MIEAVGLLEKRHILLVHRIDNLLTLIQKPRTRLGGKGFGECVKVKGSDRFEKATAKNMKMDYMM